MATNSLKFSKIYLPSLSSSFNASGTPRYNYTEAFKYNPRSFLMKNPKQNKLYAQYFAQSKKNNRRRSRGRKQSSPAGSTSSSSSSSSSSSGSKTSVSPPPSNQSFLPLGEESNPPSKAPASAKSSVSPSAAKSSTEKSESTPPQSVSPASSTLHSSSAPLSAISDLSKSPLGYFPSSGVLATLKPVAALPPSSTPSLPAKAAVPSSTRPLFERRSSNKPRLDDKERIIIKPNALKEVISKIKSDNPKVYSFDGSKIYSGVDDEKTSIKPSSSKRSRPDDEDETATAKHDSPKKRRIAAKVSTKKATTSKPVAKLSKEQLEKVRSDSLKKRRDLAAKVRKDSSRMPSAAQRGFANVTGVACYRNSLLQGLFHLPKFFNFLTDQHPVDTCDIPKKDCLACSLSLLSSKYWTVDYPTKDITSMLRKLEAQCKRLGWYPGSSGQGDPHEQITWMLEKIDEQIKASSVASMQSIMQLALSSRITCNNCHNVSVGDLQDELALSVSLKPRIRGGSLSSYLHKYLDETIEGYRCEKCKAMGDVHRVLSISHAPDILFVQLKRFGYDGRKDKLPLPIDHTLDLSPYRDPSGSMDSMEYELVASVSHSGTLNSGHYICDARGPDGRWNCYNDQYCSATTLTKALRDNPPYLLLYQRKQT